MVGQTVPLVQVLAIPPDEPRLVYEGQITGSEKQQFSFKNLPMRKYDLMLIQDRRFFEGLQLMRGTSSLTATDKEKVNASIQKSEPFFLKKIIHRLEGVTGRGNEARAICTYLRDKSSEHTFSASRGGYRRTFKLVMLKDVGPGWQIVRSRDLFPVWATDANKLPTHHVEKSLSRIRVADKIKDIGEIRLSTHF